VGDIESQPFLEAIRQLRLEVGANRSMFIHLTLVPYIKSAGEIKTKPTQHSVKELRSIGLQPDILVCRSDEVSIPLAERRKIALFTNVEERAVIPLVDAETIYQVPCELNDQGVGDLVIERLQLECQPVDLAAWEAVVDAQLNPLREVSIAIVGKYLDLLDAYKSLVEAIVHAGIHTRTKVNIDYVDAQTLCDEGTGRLDAAAGILVPGGFGERGFEGKIVAARYARENKVPYLGICYGMHAALVEFARNVAGIKDANSTEVVADTPNPVIGLVTEWLDREGQLEQRNGNEDFGGTMRLGAQTCVLSAGSIAREVYGSEQVEERHRHRYEVNNEYISRLQQLGLRVAGRSSDGSLVEMIEVVDHPWFVACQFHPEFTSSPLSSHPLFKGFIEAALARQSPQASD